MKLRFISDWLVYLVVRIFICLLQSLRIETCVEICRFLAWMADDVLKIRRELIEENLQHAFPDWNEAKRRRVRRQMWEHLLLMVCEVAQVPRKLHETNWRDIFFCPDNKLILTYLLEPRPIQLVSGHFGNFEVASYAAGFFGFPTHAVARPLDNPFLDRFINRFRESQGQFILPKRGSAPVLDNVLQRGDAVAMLADQHAGPKGCWVEFMGRPASCHKALAVFTLGSGAPMLVCTAMRRGRPLYWELGVAGVADPQLGGEELADVKQLTQWYNHRLEDLIRTAPEQYWWLHRRWRDDRPQRAAKQELRKAG